MQSRGMVYLGDFTPPGFYNSPAHRPWHSMAFDHSPAIDARQQ